MHSCSTIHAASPAFSNTHRRNGRAAIQVGVVGCGTISNAYFQGLRLFPQLIQIAACADLEPSRAQDKAAEWNIPQAGGVDEVLHHPEIDLVVNLTVPQAHAPVNLAALRHDKHVYCEKPFALNGADGREVLHFAHGRNLLVGSAPDTFLGAGLQTCRRLIDQGAIGQPVAATAFMACHGHEGWHPNPAFYYAQGGGPLFDMGPYYLTALVSLIGPVARVSASARATFDTRTIGSEPLRGTVIPVETPTHYSGVLDFANGAIGTILMSFDVWNSKLPTLEIYGTEGTLGCPDPNRFDDGAGIYLRARGESEWRNIPLGHQHQVQRGVGVADMAMAIQAGRMHRCSGELGHHVLEVMEAFEKSSTEGAHVQIESSCLAPLPLPEGLQPGEID